MKRLNLIAVLPLLALFMASCKAPVNPGEGPFQQARFMVYDHSEPHGENSSGNFYAITAYQKAVGEKCEIWVEKDAGVSEADALNIAAEYDRNIYPVINAAFGFTLEYEGKNIEILDWGDYDKNGRILILLLDIRDSYGSSNSSYIAGYFGADDFNSRTVFSASNEADMIYVDINPGVKLSEQFYATIAHEMQHLIHFLANATIRSKGTYGEHVASPMDDYREQDLWIDEGLSSAAEYLYLKNHPRTQLNWFNLDPNSTIRKGNNFFVWDGGYDEYATVYLFFQWLRIQAGNNEIYRDIMMSKSIGYQAVSNAAADYFKDPSYADWEILLRAWFAANYINASSGPYGYRGELTLKTYTLPRGTTSVELKPGEGVYSVLSGDNDFTPAGNISYAGLVQLPAAVNIEAPRIGERLLTFNKKSSPGPGSETGQTTGTAASIQSEETGPSRAAAVPQGPYPISVRDYHQYAKN